MELSLTRIGLAVVAFASTNIDDLFLLVAFFADRSLRTRDVIIGQYVGIAAIYVASVVVSLISLIIPPAFVGLLGLVPIAIGIRKLVKAKDTENPDKLLTAPAPGACTRSLMVAAVTVANGGDNIAVYAALFASGSRSELAFIGAVFAVMAGVWCFAAHWLVNHRAIGAPIRDRAQRVVPFAIVGIGLLILIRSGALQFR